MLASGQGGSPLRGRDPHRRQQFRRSGPFAGLGSCRSERHGDQRPGLLSESAFTAPGRRRSGVLAPQAVITAARMLNLTVVSTFVGRDWTRSVDENWPRFLSVWKDLVSYAEDHGIRIAIENCPMLFTADEWPGGKNLAFSPAIWQRMYLSRRSRALTSGSITTRRIWCGSKWTILRHCGEFSSRIFRVHLKDVAVDRKQLDISGHPGVSPRVPFPEASWTWGHRLGEISRCT